MGIRTRIKEKIFAGFVSVIEKDLYKSFEVISHLTLKERYKLFKLAKDKQVILEIGSYIGASACCFGAALSNDREGKIVCVDTWKNDAMTEGGRETWEEFLSNTNEYKKVIFPVRGFSTKVIEQVRKIIVQADLLFIDGDHSYEGVKADWEFYKVFLDSGSIVIFHDYGWAEGVQRVVDEDVKPMVSSYSQLPNMWWGTLSRKP